MRDEVVDHIGRIKVIDNSNEDYFKWVCICPHCGEKTTYGEMHMHCGEHGCPKCADDLRDSIEFDRKNHYDRYVRKANNNDYEPYKYVEDK